MDVPAKGEGTGDVRFDAVYKELVFIRMALTRGPMLLLLRATAFLLLAAVILLAVLVLRTA